MLLRARVSVSCTDPGPWPAACLSQSGDAAAGGGRRVRVVHEHVAGIDVHKDMIKVAIRSPGEKDTRTTEILEFRTFYGVLQEVARLLRQRGVTHVVMEASGVYTDPVYYAMCEQDFTEVAVVNPAHARALRGHKTDAADCRRLAELSGCGLLRGSYIPPAELREVRDLTRYRMKTVQARTSEIQRRPTRNSARTPAPGRNHPPSSTPTGTAPPEALPRLRRHHHHQPAGGRLNIPG